uniref:Uncharacterized protein n=1 Tax=Anguilla anguilla TaxID=7936 RepID=A0A0E9VNV5_ANGAN
MNKNYFIKYLLRSLHKLRSLMIMHTSAI